jgi:hypothetical protein
MHLRGLMQLVALAYIVRFPHRLQISEVKALGLVHRVGEIVHGAGDDMVDFPLPIIVHRHTAEELPFQVLY